MTFQESRGEAEEGKQESEASSHTTLCLCCSEAHKGILREVAATEPGTKAPGTMLIRHSSTGSWD